MQGMSVDDSRVNLTPPREKKGVFLSYPIGFVLVLLAVVLAVGVGVIVTFAGPRREVKCECHFPRLPDPTLSPGEQLQVCTSLATTLGRCICPPGVSPGPPTTTTHPDVTTTEPPTEPPTKPPVRDFRLPTDIEPLSYLIELQPDIYGDDPSQFKTTGNVAIQMKVLKATNTVIMHGYQLVLDTDTIKFEAEGGGANPGKPVFEADTDRQFLKFTFSSPLAENGIYTFSVSYTAPLRKGDTRGLYWSSYLEGNETRYLATTQFQPFHARRAFPCFDEPGFKSYFDIILVKKQGWTALSNMPEIRNETRADGWIAVHFDTTLKQSAYLLAMVVCDYISIEATSDNGHVHRVWGRPSAIRAGHGDYALSISGKIIDYFEKYMDFPYPLNKTDQISIPDFAAGAMENWGLITYRENRLLYDPAYSTTIDQQRVALIIGHEVLHSWFGNLVTCKFWDETWLNEGFARYMQYFPIDHIYPQWEMRESVVSDVVQTVMVTDQKNTSQPIYVELDEFPFKTNAFSTITYSKGGSILRMINYTLSEATFHKAIQKYLKRHAYGAVTSSDLFNAFTEQASEDGKPLNATEKFSSWIYQMFYPVLKVKGPGVNKELSQTKFFIDPTETAPKASPYNYQWNIPLTFTDGIKPDFYKPVDAWLDQKNGSMALTASSWVLMNTQQQGFYRVDYDLTNWRALISQLNRNHSVIHLRNRAQLIDDAFSLSRAGNSEVDAVLAFQLAEHLANDTEYITWRALLRNKPFITNMLSRKSPYGAYQRFLRSRMDKVFTEIKGLEDEDSHPHKEKLLRYNLAPQACKHGHLECVTQAKNKFQQWRNDPSIRVRPNVKYTVFCTGILHGTDKDWDAVYDFYKSIDVARNPLHLSHKNVIRSSLSCSELPWILNRYLDLALNASITPESDVNTILTQIAGNLNGRNIIWDWLRSNWDNARENYYAMGLVSIVTDSFSSAFELQQIVDLQKSISSPSASLSKNFRTIIAKVKANMRWVEKNEKPLSDWLMENY